MTDRKASFCAVAASSLAIGGFYAARPTGASSKIRIIEQAVLPPGGVGQDRDAAAIYRVEMPAVVREAIDDNQPVTFALTDAYGRTYPLDHAIDPGLGGALKLSAGFQKAPVSPRLVATSSGKTLARSTIVQSPQAQDFALTPAEDSPVEILHRGESWLEVKAKKPIPPGERWRVTLRRTAHADIPDVIASLPARFGRWPSNRIVIPFAGEAEAVEMTVERFRMNRKTDVVRIPGLRLVERFGGTGLMTDEKKDIPTKFGVPLRIPQQYTGPRRPLRNGDPRTAMATILFAPSGTDQDPNITEAMRRDRGIRVELLPPSPDDLGLRELHIGPSTRVAQKPPTGPVKLGPFEATLRITMFEAEPIGTFETVSAIKYAPLTAKDLQSSYYDSRRFDMRLPYPR